MEENNLLSAKYTQHPLFPNTWGDKLTISETLAPVSYIRDKIARSLLPRFRLISGCSNKRTNTNLVKYLTIEGIQLLLEQPDINRKRGRRDLAILSLGYMQIFYQDSNIVHILQMSELQQGADFLLMRYIFVPFQANQETI